MYKNIKRILDFLIALILLIILAIPMLVIALLIRIEDKGPALFKQVRTGKDGKNFELMKFRSMKVNNDVHDFSTEDQYTKIGKIIRKTSLDELPQIFNILKGEMSFIGPRPWITDYYELMNDKQRGRVKVLPGITGLAQVNGRNAITVDDRINYDLEYIEKLSFKQDIYVFFKTFTAIFKSSGTCNNKGGIKWDLDELREQNKKEVEIIEEKPVTEEMIETNTETNAEIIEENVEEIEEQQEVVEENKELVNA